MKKFVAAILILMMLIPAVSAAPDGMVFKLSGGEAAVGENVTLTATVENAPLCSSFRVFFTYDTETLEIVNGKKADVGGMFLVNKEAKYQEQPAVSALAADASKVFEGNATLFTLTFKLKKEPADGELIKLAYSEFFDGDMKPVSPAFEIGKITLKTATQEPDNGADQPAENTPSTPTLPEGNWGVEDDKVVVEDENGNKTDFTPGEDYKEPEAGETVTTPIYGEDKNQAGTVVVEKDENGTVTVTPMKPLPEGNWIVTGNQALVMDSEGNATIYDTEYDEPEVGGTTEAPLYQEGKPVGSVTIGKDEAGNLTVTPNDPADNGEDKGDQPFFPWIVWVGAAIAVGCGLAVAVGSKLKKKKRNTVEE